MFRHPGKDNESDLVDGGILQVYVVSQLHNNTWSRYVIVALLLLGEEYATDNDSEDIENNYTEDIENYYDVEDIVNYMEDVMNNTEDVKNNEMEKK